LRLPKAIQEENYDHFRDRFARAMSEIVKLAQSIPKFAKEAIRLFAKNVKNTA
jgi:hypothetical protein